MRDVMGRACGGLSGHRAFKHVRHVRVWCCRYCMSRCHALIISNSTFSFTAAMASEPMSATTDHPSPDSSPPFPRDAASCTCTRFWRPSPTPSPLPSEAAAKADAADCGGALTLEWKAFDPWDAYPLLNVSRGRKPKQQARGQKKSKRRAQSSPAQSSSGSSASGHDGARADATHTSSTRTALHPPHMESAAKRQRSSV